MLFFNLRERYGDNHPSLRRQSDVIFDLIFRVAESKGTKNLLENVPMPRDKAFPHMCRKITIWFVAQKIDKPEEIPRIFLYRSAANAPMKVSESELLPDKNPSNGTARKGTRQNSLSLWYGLRNDCSGMYIPSYVSGYEFRNLSSVGDSALYHLSFI